MPCTFRKFILQVANAGSWIIRQGVDVPEEAFLCSREVKCGQHRELANHGEMRPQRRPAEYVAHLICSIKLLQLLEAEYDISRGVVHDCILGNGQVGQGGQS
jgi:hypothetical protein